jgi:hypothetical protein
VALTESDLSELLAAFRAGEITDTIRSSLEWVLQQLIEAEATAVIGAGSHERTESRMAQGNGHRPKLISTGAGDVELAIPKLRQGSFFPSLLERHRRIDRALYAVVMEAYVHGISTRKVDDLVKALGAASGISKSEVSRICAELDRDLQALPVCGRGGKALSTRWAPGRWCWSRWSARSEARTYDLDRPEGRCMLGMGRPARWGRPALPRCSTNRWSSATTIVIGCPPL